ncbi:ABC transporter [Roseibium aquae]|uniref:ABC transporter n=1 Tax=Roseibium aquae TaxID=1323746 RepID=A0A916T8M7_9HYPH|nr:ATP-binding cassette domain-containing protein [Roseibium aquae]GGB33358.1 ABC transporter [Roseibium aquae]
MSLAALSDTGSLEASAERPQTALDLDARLRQQTGSRPDRASAAENCLLPLLKALGWNGMERHLFEALPHLEGIQSVFDLRAVLTRLNYHSNASQRRPGSLQAEHFPCLIETEEDVLVCLGRRNDGQLTAFSGKSNEEVSVRPSALKTATVYLINPDDTIAGARPSEFKHWSSRLFYQFRGTVMAILAVGFLANLLALALPLFVMNVYDKAIGARSPMVLLTLLAGIGVILIVEGMVKKTKARLQAYFGSRLDSVISTTTFRHFLHLPLQMTAAAPIGAQITRLKQFDGVRDVFHGNLANALIDLPFSALFILVLALIGGPLALLPAGLLLVYVVAAFTMIPRMKRAINIAGEAKSRLQNITVETLMKHKAIRDLSADDIWLEKHNTLSADFAKKNLKTKQLSHVMQTLSQMMMTICGVGVLGFGAVMAMNGNLSQGGLIAVMALSWRSLNPMHQAFMSLTQLGQAQQTVERINGLLKLDMERQPGKLPSLYRQFRGTLRFSNVVLRYPGRQEPSLRNFSLQIEQGSVVAVTGPSGCGKTSLIRAILGLYRPQMGAILVDDQDIRQLDPGEWRNAIGYAPEQFDFFYGTIAQNLRMADPQADDSELMKIFEEFGLHHYSDFLPQGIDTRLTGQLLSRIPDNVQQRILLARAFIRPAPIYVLDDPAGNLDFDGDKLLMNKIDAVRGASTVIMTTYRPSHMRMADHVVAMKNGMVAVSGKPEEVLDEIMARQGAQTAKA